ncbi:MAG: Polysaccharide deacetylase [Candidatus Methanoperedens nitroreducens]|uniref:Polysaccharide deacetylase n=1 Tax=Candidatus Methanoperedens nitratireducens TaxID=1392998 RepID=A0A0P8ABJ6_9EURY|nr:polysaccharide deacetylase family protein [Candidatus Methanoperedens sp. BLZ2]KAB2943835.1 MAG: polysaccharide deacetylase family protein [Candidatus Methanoperedens sp.]KPQ44006.1 MAG: Polysaccharide deacetylase [Candidatus Methanoperedens sp. BLZ1]MBZ0177421.1 polysaccharide deacetylase family protein [Candidatus Methanoperedens nitroreducens]MCX9077851.1 polysaccharide deacetylase family protein [Candidatus Methanoperedens sp.]
MSKTKILIGITICLMFLTMVGAAERPTVIITFDDGWLSVYNKAYPIMQANNQKGVDFVIIDPILGGWSDFTQRSQLNTLYAAGWDISSHTYSHIALTTANNTTLNYELAASKDWLNANGYPGGAMLLAYPYGDYNSNVIAALKANGYVAARTIEASTNNMHYNLSSPDIFSLKSYEVIGGQDNDTTIINQIDNTIASNGLLILAFHKIVDTLSANATNAETEFTTSDFQKVSNYLKSRNVDVRTLSDYFGVVPIITNSPVAGIPAAPKNTRSDYTIERVYYIPAETQPIEVATPKSAETPDLNIQISSGGWVAVNNQENITKEPEKSIFEKIVEFLRRFYA